MHKGLYYFDEDQKELFLASKRAYQDTALIRLALCSLRCVSRKCRQNQGCATSCWNSSRALPNALRADESLQALSLLLKLHFACLVRKCQQRFEMHQISQMEFSTMRRTRL